MRPFANSKRNSNQIFFHLSCLFALLFLLRRYKHQHLCEYRHQNHIQIRWHSYRSNLLRKPIFCFKISKFIITFTKEKRKQSLYFINSLLDNGSFIPELSTDINISSSCAHGKTNNQSSFNELVWVVTQNLSVLASARLGLISVNDKVGWSVLVRKISNKRTFPMKFLMNFSNN